MHVYSFHIGNPGQTKSGNNTTVHVAEPVNFVGITYRGTEVETTQVHKVHPSMVTAHKSWEFLIHCTDYK